MASASRRSAPAYVAAQGWTLVPEHEDVASGYDDRRPRFQAALAQCRQLGAVLLAARPDRITRRVLAVVAIGGGVGDPGGRPARRR